MNKRVILIVMDGVGIGEMPDASRFGDVGSNSLGNLALAINGGVNLPTLQKLGLGNAATIQDQSFKSSSVVIRGLDVVENPLAHYGKMKELSPGKDSVYGHWELMGCLVSETFTCYPDGFPKEIIGKFEEETGRQVIGNCVASGTEIVDKLGSRHIRTGGLIVYTSADSVFQIAAHEEVVPVQELYKICEVARRILDKYFVARVIARPFIGEPGSFKRTDYRKDFSMKPPTKTVLDQLQENGIKVVGFGKVDDLFVSRGVDQGIKVLTNRDTLNKISREMARVDRGLLFANCNDTDTTYGHRRDVVGYEKALKEIDSGVARLIEEMTADDLLILCADHGCDPTFLDHTDHTREYVPLLIYSKGILKGKSLGVRETFADVGATISKYFDIDFKTLGQSVL